MACKCRSPNGHSLSVLRGTLYDLVGGMAAAKAAAVVIRGTHGGEAEQKFVNAVLMETAEQLGIPPEEIADASGEPAVRRGALNWSWVQGILRVIDQKVTDGSAAAIAIGTKDVYRYLYDPVIGVDIDAGVREAIKPNVPTVVVTHSLGTVVGYRLLTRVGVTRKWRVPLFVTLGSPLGVGAVHQALLPVRHPECADAWYNAMDTRDVVALYPLDTGHFNIKPAIENNTQRAQPDVQPPRYRGLSVRQGGGPPVYKRPSGDGADGDGNAVRGSPRIHPTTARSSRGCPTTGHAPN